VLGRGSNVLVDDAGFDGTVIVNRAEGLSIEGATVHAESGVLLSVLARRTVAAGLVGLEWCHDIPGTVGGAVVNNAGANGGAIADVLRRARVLPVGGAAREMDAAELQFDYRHSALRAEVAVPTHARPVVLTACFAVQRGAVEAIKERMAAQRARRKATQPGGASAGSVFKNPPGDSAGRLVESVGLKGARHGDAAVSTLHANFIVNGPRATAADVLARVALMRQRVYAAHGVELEPEVQFVWRDGHIGPPPEDCP
jgi:UDP-N-acetylmuramate dehydrogenase